MVQRLIETRECLEWLRDVYKIANAPQYRMAILQGNEDSATRISLYARNHDRSKPAVWVPDDNGNYVQIQTGARPQEKYLVYRPLVDTPHRICESEESLLLLARQIATANDHRFAVVWEDTNGTRLRAVALYARLGQRRLPSIYIPHVSGRKSFDKFYFGQCPDPKFLADRPKTDAEITQPIKFEELEQ